MELIFVFSFEHQNNTCLSTILTKKRLILNFLLYLCMSRHKLDRLNQINQDSA